MLAKKRRIEPASGCRVALFNVPLDSWPRDSRGFRLFEMPTPDGARRLLAVSQSTTLDTIVREAHFEVEFFGQFGPLQGRVPVVPETQTPWPLRSGPSLSGSVALAATRLDIVTRLAAALYSRAPDPRTGMTVTMDDAIDLGIATADKLIAEVMKVPIEGSVNAENTG